MRCPPPVTGGVCLATRVRYRQSCGLDTWSALLAYLFVSRICVAGLCFFFFALVLFFPLPSDQIGGGFLVCYFVLSFSSFVCVFGCSDGMEREACVCDHGFERSDLCAEIIINNNNKYCCIHRTLYIPVPLCSHIYAYTVLLMTCMFLCTATSYL